MSIEFKPQCSSVFLAYSSGVLAIWHLRQIPVCWQASGQSKKVFILRPAQSVCLLSLCAMVYYLPGALLAYCLCVCILLLWLLAVPVHTVHTTVTGITLILKPEYDDYETTSEEVSGASMISKLIYGTNVQSSLQIKT